MIQPLCKLVAYLFIFRWEMSAFKLDSVYQVELPPVNKMSDQIYTSYVLCGKHGPGPPKANDMETYRRYLYCKYR